MVAQPAGNLENLMADSQQNAGPAISGAGQQPQTPDTRRDFAAIRRALLALDRFIFSGIDEARIRQAIAMCDFELGRQSGVPSVARWQVIAASVDEVLDRVMPLSQVPPVPASLADPNVLDAEQLSVAVRILIDAAVCSSLAGWTENPPSAAETASAARFLQTAKGRGDQRVIDEELRRALSKTLERLKARRGLTVRNDLEDAIKRCTEILEAQTKSVIPKRDLRASIKVAAADIAAAAKREAGGTWLGLERTSSPSFAAGVAGNMMVFSPAMLREYEKLVEGDRRYSASDNAPAPFTQVEVVAQRPAERREGAGARSVDYGARQARRRSGRGSQKRVHIPRLVAGKYRTRRWTAATTARRRRRRLVR
jgi:hypothetical protein